MIKAGTMLPDPQHPIFSLTDLPRSTAGSTHLFTMLSDSSKHIALFIIADHSLHEPHPLFLKFASICKPYRESLRPVVLARASRIGGLRKPNWCTDDMLFLGTSPLTETTFGLNGKGEMGVIIVRPDGYVAYSISVGTDGANLDSMAKWLTKSLKV